jgi:RNA polymerase sigma-70 factor (ECF subfamily)
MTGDVRQQMVALLPRLRRCAYSLMGSMDDVNDVVQAACERALARMQQFEPGTRLDSWMFRNVQTVWIDMTRYSGRRRRVSDWALETVAHDARICEEVEARSYLAIVREQVAHLPEEQRLVLAL